MSNKKLTDARRAASVTMQMASMPIPAPEGWGPSATQSMGARKKAGPVMRMA